MCGKASRRNPSLTWRELYRKLMLRLRAALSRTLSFMSLRYDTHSPVRASCLAGMIHTHLYKLHVSQVWYSLTCTSFMSYMYDTHLSVQAPCLTGMIHTRLYELHFSQVWYSPVRASCLTGMIHTHLHELYFSQVWYTLTCTSFISHRYDTLSPVWAMHLSPVTVCLAVGLGVLILLGAKFCCFPIFGLSPLMQCWQYHAACDWWCHIATVLW